MAKGKYREWLSDDRLTLLRGWARRGLTDEEIAKKIGIAAGTLYDWKNRFPKIDEALKKGKAVYDDEAEESLYDLVLGYYKDEDTVVKDADGAQRVKRIRKWYPPNVTAIIFWLKNRRPGDWRDVRAQEIAVKKSVSDTESEIGKYLDDDKAVENEPQGE